MVKEMEPFLAVANDLRWEPALFAQECLVFLDPSLPSML